MSIYMELLRKILFLLLGCAAVYVGGKIFKNIIGTIICLVILYFIYRFWGMI